MSELYYVGLSSGIVRKEALKNITVIGGVTYFVTSIVNSFVYYYCGNIIDFLVNVWLINMI